MSFLIGTHKNSGNHLPLTSCTAPFLLEPSPLHIVSTVAALDIKHGNISFHWFCKNSTI